MTEPKNDNIYMSLYVIIFSRGPSMDDVQQQKGNRKIKYSGIHRTKKNQHLEWGRGSQGVTQGKVGDMLEPRLQRVVAGRALWNSKKV
jgi:hypothetical protein